MAPRERLYGKKTLEHLDPEERYERAFLLEKIKDANYWKKTVFELLEGKQMNAKQVQQEMLDKNYRRELSLDSVVKTLKRLAELGFLRCADPGVPPEQCEFSWNVEK